MFKNNNNLIYLLIGLVLLAIYFSRKTDNFGGLTLVDPNNIKLPTDIKADSTVVSILLVNKFIDNYQLDKDNIDYPLFY
jgi:hypothetical protein